MRVLHVIDKMEPARGGVCQAVRSMIKGLELHNVHSEVVCLDSPGEKFLEKDPYVTHALGPAENPWTYSPKLKPWFVSNLNSFDIVIVHGLWQYPGYAVHQAVKKSLYNAGNKKNQVPKIFVMPHGMLDPYFQKAPERKLKALRNIVYWKLIEKKVVNTADGLLFTCEEEAKLAQIPFTPYRPKKECIVGLGVEDPPVFDDAMKRAFLHTCPQIQNSPYLLFLSRIHEKKGVDLLLNAYSKFIKELQENILSLSEKPIEVPKLAVAGPGLDTPYGQRIQKQVSDDVVLKNNVVFTGMLSGDAKWGAFYCCDAFILPSHQENFGIAIVEALACKKPVLISNRVNIYKEIISNNGGIVKEDTLKGTYELMMQWMKMDSSEQIIMGITARNVYENIFAVKTAADTLIKAISE